MIGHMAAAVIIGLTIARHTEQRQRTMQSDESDRLLVALSSSAALTVSLVGFTIQWKDVGWLAPLDRPEYARLLFIPLFLTSVFCGMQLLGLNPRSSLLGISPKVWWIAAAFLVAVILAPATHAEKLWFTLWTTGLLLFTWRIWKQFARAEEMAAGNLRQQRR